MDEQNSEVLKRLEKIEQELSELQRKVDALTGDAAPTRQKQPRGKLFLFIGIPILLLCLLVGGYYVFRTTRTLEPTDTEEEIPYAGAEVGDIITFGKYEQNNSQADGSEPIEWIVLDKKDGRILLLSKYILYTDQMSGTAWIDCRLRSTLNKNFLFVAFTADEQNRIYEIENDEGTYSPADKVFLLSEEEVEMYFPSEESRKCGYTNASNAIHNAWWLRSFSQTEDGKGTLYHIAYITAKGEIRHEAYRAKGDKSQLYGTSFGVRPALWLDTTK